MRAKSSDLDKVKPSSIGLPGSTQLKLKEEAQHCETKTSASKLAWRILEKGLDAIRRERERREARKAKKEQDGNKGPFGDFGRHGGGDM